MYRQGVKSRVATAIAAALLGGAAGCTQPQLPAVNPEQASIDRGAYLATVASCGDCHTPKVFSDTGPAPDKARLLSGHRADQSTPEVPEGVIAPNKWGALTTGDLTVWAGPWGISYAANLTPDASGLAEWTADTFIQAMRTGKHAGTGRPILPPMPWQEYAKMTDDDLRAIFAYLKSIPPISNVVPQPIPPPSADSPG